MHCWIWCCARRDPSFNKHLRKEVGKNLSKMVSPWRAKQEWFKQERVWYPRPFETFRDGIACMNHTTNSVLCYLYSPVPIDSRRTIARSEGLVSGSAPLRPHAQAVLAATITARQPDSVLAVTPRYMYQAPGFTLVLTIFIQLKGHHQQQPTSAALPSVTQITQITQTTQNQPTSSRIEDHHPHHPASPRYLDHAASTNFIQLQLSNTQITQITQRY